MAIPKKDRVKGKKLGKRTLTDSPKGQLKGYTRRSSVMGRKNVFTSQAKARTIAKELRLLGWMVRVLPISKNPKRWTLYTRPNDKCYR